MPNLINIIQMAESLESKAVFLAQDRCVVVRNRHSSCKKCSEACPVDAVYASDNVLKLDASACVACGACTTVCPTEALIPLVPLDEDLSAVIVQATKEAGGKAVFACARIASKRLANPSQFAEVPCLARIEESVLLGLVSRGICDLMLVDGTCKTCKYHACIAGIEKTVSSANELLAAQGSRVRIHRSSAFPRDILLKDENAQLGFARRGFFNRAKGSAKEAASKTVEVALNKNTKEPSLRERLKVSDAGTLPQFNPIRRMNVLDAMDLLGNSVLPHIRTRLFGSVEIDASSCTTCTMCTVFCPTGALRKSEIASSEGEEVILEFSAADCVQCNLCADACIANCLSVQDEVATDDLFDFEPRLIHLSPTPPNSGILSAMG